MKEELAKEFSRLLREELPNNDFKKLVKLEKQRILKKDNPNICHSHDFCDANAIMLTALETVIGRMPVVSVLEPEDMQLMHVAWREAQTNLFYS